MIDTILFSNDSSYAGISFVANYIENSITILRQAVRSDFDKMINNKIYLSKQRQLALDTIKKSKRIIVFGIISLNNINLSLYRDKEITVIISDTEFVRKSKKINTFLLNNKYIKVLIMPDLIQYMDKRIKHKPYYQHIPIPDDISIVKNENVTISHSPGFKYKLDLKGSSFIEKELKNLHLVVIRNKEWKDCIELKAKSHIFVDQMIDKTKDGYRGGVGKSGLEAMLVKNLLITSSDKLITEPFFENPPVIYSRPNTFKNAIMYYVNNLDVVDDISEKQYKWAKKHTSIEFVKNNILN